MTDHRKFVFTATGETTDIANFGVEDLYDNMIAEIDRLDALIGLLSAVRRDEVEPHVLSGLALLLGDVRARMRAMLDLAHKRATKA